MNPLKREIDAALFELTVSPGLKRRTLARIERYEEANNMKKRYKLSGILIALLALLFAGVAYAAVTQWGVLDLLAANRVIPTERARDTILNNLNVAPVMVDDVRFELTDAAYDGQQIYISLRTSSDTKTTMGRYTWSHEALEPELYTGVESVAINGQVVDFNPTEDRYVDGITYGMISVPYAMQPGEQPEITLELRVFTAGATQSDTGELRFTLPVKDDAAQTIVIDEPISMKGVTVTYMELKYTPLKLYVTLKYTIDPELPRFERLRRESMFFELWGDEAGLQGYSGRSAKSDDEDAYTVQSEYVATDTPYQHLTVELRGADTEVYWIHNFDFEEGAK